MWLVLTRKCNCVQARVMCLLKYMILSNKWSLVWVACYAEVKLKLNWSLTLNRTIWSDYKGMQSFKCMCSCSAVSCWNTELHRFYFHLLSRLSGCERMKILGWGITLSCILLNGTMLWLSQWKRKRKHYYSSKLHYILLCVYCCERQT